MERRNLITYAMSELRRDHPDGPRGSGPFTGNTHESRQIESLSIKFTRTRGGSPPVSLSIDDLFVEAYEFSQFLLGKLQTQRDEIDKQITAI